ncbi:hypothetical protein PIB30_102520, partial [Stylosanthes scabra]|nr:hypothetical protein [Stylosanthes scabra]
MWLSFTLSPSSPPLIHHHGYCWHHHTSLGMAILTDPNRTDPLRTGRFFQRIDRVRGGFG